MHVELHFARFFVNIVCIQDGYLYFRSFAQIKVLLENRVEHAAVVTVAAWHLQKPKKLTTLLSFGIYRTHKNCAIFFLPPKQLAR